MGDINGIGPEILARSLCRPSTWSICRPAVLGDLKLLDTMLDEHADRPRLVQVESLDSLPDEDWVVPVLTGGLCAPSRRPGVLDAEAGRCAVEWLKLAIQSAMNGSIDGLVTCPLNKEGIHLAGYSYQGHTEVLAEMTSSPDYRMCLFTNTLRIVHISSHFSVAEAVKLVKRERVAKSIEIAHESLVRLGLDRKRIAVAALNPHAGEAGAFGHEEQAEIVPALEECRAKGIDCDGPFPPDTVFRRMLDGEFDLVVAMYHDQGHIPLKLIAMDEGVNVTLGLPIIRTSVDHGTAYDIAGTGTARDDSLCAAIQLAAKLAGLR